MPADMVPDMPVDMVADMPDQATGPVCGNGVIEAPETCDGNCPQSCEAMVCQTATMSGTPQNCDVDCSYQAIVTCTNNDGCCAPGCNANNTLTHTGSDGSSFSQRASAAGYTGFAANENAGKGYSTPASVVQGWMNSDGHCANVMNPNINRVGVGYYLHATSGRWWTMVGGINGN